jgi:3-hydroxymyristoyl/3-hydroxydecanoyl-(acyl carrier protein) dehydratase
LKEVTAALEFTLQHPALRGHFPGNPIVPAVVLLDEVLHLASISELGSGATALQWHIGQAKFHRALRPGEPLTLVLERRADGRVGFTLSAASARVAQGLLLPAAGASAPE